MSGWKVVYIASRQEKKVHHLLNEKHVESYLPLVKRLRQWSDRKKWVEFPMFPGYLFVRPQTDMRDSVLQIPGVVAYLRYNKADAIVTDKEILSIKSIESSGYSSETIVTAEDFKIDDELVVTEGPLRGQRVKLISKKNTKIFVVLFETIGQAVKVDLPYHIVSKSMSG